MPLITIEGPKINNIENKRLLAKKLTEAAAEIYSMDKKHIVVVIKENPPENVATAGELICDIKK
ncbi:MAG: tautomerase family protein [Candidatus Omnitrophica bacterium]|jgi:4-oxalocrotonate tautomerase|nr:tautomerase family protein [Candidatus Omnitrophota bacterium]